MIPANAINIDAEQALLGACIMSGDVVDAIDGTVRPEDFSEPVHVEIFRAVTRARAEGRRIDLTLIRSVLGQWAKAELVAGLTTGEYAARLVSAAPTLVNAPDYARIVSETANYRRLIAAADDLRARAIVGHPAGTPSELAADAIVQIDAVATAGAGKVRAVSIGQAMSRAYEAAEDRALHGVVSGVTWGIADLDRVTKLHPGELTIVAARPSMGKTTLGLSTALAAAKSGEGVMFFSLEMGDVALGQRILSDACYDGYSAPIPYSDIRDGRLPEGGMERLRAAEQKLADLPLEIEQEAGLTVSQITARTRTGRQKLLRLGWQLGLVVVDHLGLITPADRYAGARHLELGAITSALKAMAKEQGVPVLLLCQLSRGVEGRENKRPMLSDLRESGRIEEDADTVILLYREAYYLERMRETDPDKDRERAEKLRAVANTLELNVAKHRQGATRVVEAFASMPNNAIRNAAHRGVM